MLALAALGCHSTGAGAGGAPTYYGDIEPILRAHCVTCHRDGGAAPLALTTYEEARSVARSIASTTHTRRMPPWPAVTEGDCPPQLGARRLTDADIATIAAWQEAGAAEGEVPAAAPALPPAWGALDRVDAVLRADAPYQPLAGTDDHRCFVVDPSISADRYLTAYAVHQDAPGIIHHIQLWAIDSDAEEAAITQLDAAASGPGYPCADSIGVTGRYVSVWAPSDPIRRHPAGTGMLLTGGHRMVIQIHYHDHGSGLADRTAIELELADHVDHPATMWPVSPPELYLPPRTPSVTVTTAEPVPADAHYRLWGVRAHMHTLGTSELVTLGDDAGSRCLLSIPAWDPNWQLMYFYEAPIDLPSGSKLGVSCTYDTTSRAAPVQYGLSSDDEMCFAFFYVTQN